MIKNYIIIVLVFSTVSYIINNNNINNNFKIFGLEYKNIDNNIAPLLIPPYKSILDSANFTESQRYNITFVNTYNHP